MADFPSSFAQRQLEKFGWSKGSGLGKNNNGIVEPIKVKKKFSRLGLGATYDLSKNGGDFFENLYNKAASCSKGVPSDKSIVTSANVYDSSKSKRQQNVSFQLHTVLNGTEELSTEHNSRKRQRTPASVTDSSGTSTDDETEHVSARKTLKSKKKSKDPLPHSFSDTNLFDLGKLARKPFLGCGKLARAAEFI